MATLIEIAKAHGGGTINMRGSVTSEAEYLANVEVLDVPRLGWAALQAAIAQNNLVVVIPYEDFQNRFTTVEFDNATDFIEQVNTTTGKPARPALKQGMARVYAKGTIDLTAPRTIAFMDALVAGGVITAQRKTAILTP